MGALLLDTPNAAFTPSVLETIMVYIVQSPLSMLQLQKAMLVLRAKSSKFLKQLFLLSRSCKKVQDAPVAEFRRGGMLNLYWEPVWSCITVATFSKYKLTGLYVPIRRNWNKFQQITWGHLCS
jgi:hypothetical protein